VHTIRTFQGHHRQSRPRVTHHAGPGKGQWKSVVQSALSQARPDDVCEFKLAHGVESAQYHDRLGIELYQAVPDRVSIHRVHKIRCGTDRFSDSRAASLTASLACTPPAISASAATQATSSPRLSTPCSSCTTPCLIECIGFGRLCT
jgi:hypothetical protein